MNNQLVSIIIPCYNYGHFLAETLNSILLQTYQVWECIIVDDGSTDNTKDVAREYENKDARFKYIYQCNKGTSTAKNNGLLQVSGSYIQFLDADDLIAPQKLGLQVNYLINNPSVDLIYGNVRYFNTNNPSKYTEAYDLSDTPWMPCISGRGDSILKLLMVFKIMVISSPLIRKKLIDEVNYFNIQLKGYEDWEFWIRCALTGSYFQYDDRKEVFTFIRVHPASAQKNGLSMLEEETKMHKIVDNLPALPNNLKSINYSLYLEKKKQWAFRLIELGYLKKGFKEVSELIALDKSKSSYYLKKSLYWLKVYFISRLNFSKRLGFLKRLSGNFII